MDTAALPPTGAVPGRATDLLLVNLGRPRREELIKLAVQILLYGAHPGVTDFLPQKHVLMFIDF